MATVYLAEDARHGRLVAVKVMKPGTAAAVGHERFLREIQTIARLTHPHILPLFDSGSADGRLYFVMPHIEGPSLRARLKTDRQLPLDEALRLARGIASALGHAHQQGLVHRDIKPANILLSDGIALVADFGIARAASRGLDSQILQHQRLTRLGLPPCLAPIHDRSPDHGIAEYDAARMIVKAEAAEGRPTRGQAARTHHTHAPARSDTFDTANPRRPARTEQTPRPDRSERPGRACTWHRGPTAGLAPPSPNRPSWNSYVHIRSGHTWCSRTCERGVCARPVTAG